MGRNRSFSEDDVIALCASAFRRTGYEGTSIDDLVQATRLHRGSLYKAFGSKRGVFLLTLRQSPGPDDSPWDRVDLLLVALMELAPRDREIRDLVMSILGSTAPPLTAEALGQRLLDRAHETITDLTPKDAA